MSYGVQVVSLIIIFIVVMEFFRYRRLTLLTTKIYEILICLFVFNILIKSVCIFSYQHPEFFSILSSKAIHQLFYASQNISFWMIFMYVDLKTRAIRNYTSFQFLWRTIPLCVSVLMIIFGDINYHSDSDGAYAFGTISNSSYFAFGCYFLLIVSLFFRSEISKRQLYGVEFILFLIIWLSTAVLMYFVPYMHLSSGTSCIAVLFFFLIFENPKDHTDKDISNIFSRHSFEYTIQELLKLNRHFWVINFSLQNVDSIRSTYGQKACIECLEKAIRTVPDYKTHNIFRTLEYSFGFIIYSKDKLDDLYGNYKLTDRTLLLSDYMVSPSFYVCSVECPTIVSESDALFDLLSFCKNTEVKISDRPIHVIDSTIAQKRDYIDAIERLLQKAIDEDGFEVYYQPIVNAITKKCVYFEALVRLKDDSSLGYISPEVFIPIAEKKGLISKLGDRVINKVCNFIRKYNLDKKSLGGVGVNLSGIQLADPVLSYKLNQAVKNYDISPKFINYEITETTAVHSGKVAKSNIEKLKDFGFRFSMDDFGTGYSNFYNMSSISYDLIKIDKSIIWQAFDSKSRKSMTVLLSIINMIHAIGCSIVAEGVETDAQADFLKESGIEFLQGYFFSKPLAPELFLEYLSNNTDDLQSDKSTLLSK